MISFFPYPANYEETFKHPLNIKNMNPEMPRYHYVPSVLCEYRSGNHGTFHKPLFLNTLRYKSTVYQKQTLHDYERSATFLPPFL